MKTLCASVLIFESIVVLLAIPVAINAEAVPAAAGVTVGLLIVIACVVLSGMQRRASWGVQAGWAMQAIILATGFVVPTMFFLGAVFALLWFYAIKVGKQGDLIKIERDAAVAAREEAEAAT